MTYNEIIKSIVEGTEMKIAPEGIVFPIFWGEDENGNVEFDLDSVFENYKKLEQGLYEHNQDIQK